MRVTKPSIFSTPSYAQRQCFDEPGRWRPGSDTHGPRNHRQFLHTFTRFGHDAQMSGGTLLIDIAGANTGQFSVLDVLGTANLNGILDPVLVNGFIPTKGERFIFLDYGSHFGAFSSIQNAIFDNGMEKWSVTYTHNDAILRVLPAHANVPDQGSTLLLLTLSLLGLMNVSAWLAAQTRGMRMGNLLLFAMTP